MTSYLLAGPAIEPVSVAEAKAFCRVDDSVEDGLIGSLIAAARLHVEASTGRALIAQSWRVVLDCWPLDGEVRLPVAPAIELSAVRAFDAADESHDIDPAQFRVTGAGGQPLLLVPADVADMPVLRQRQGIEVDYVAGYGEAADDVPADLRQAVKLLVGHWFENRDAALAPGEGTPAGLTRLLAPYRVVRL